MELKYKKGDKVAVMFNGYTAPCRIVGYGTSIGWQHFYLVKEIIGKEPAWEENDPSEHRLVPEWRIVGNV